MLFNITFKRHTSRIILQTQCATFSPINNSTKISINLINCKSLVGITYSSVESSAQLTNKHALS